MIFRPPGLRKTKFMLQMISGGPHVEKYVRWSGPFVPNLRVWKDNGSPIEALPTDEPDVYYFRMVRGSTDFFLVATWKATVYLSVEKKTKFKIIRN